MFKMVPFHFKFGSQNCQCYSIWNSCPTSRWEQFYRFIGGCPPCRYDYFPYIFWIVMGLSLAGAYTNLRECKNIFCIPNYRIKMWRPRKFYILDINLLRHSQLIGALIKSFTWLMMILALLNISPGCMTPWIMLHSILLGLDFSMWLLDVYTGRLEFDMNPLIKMGRLLCAIFLVAFMKSIFENASKSDLVDSLAIFSKC